MAEAGEAVRPRVNNSGLGAVLRSASIGVFVFVVLYPLVRSVAQDYFPIADDWALLANSSLTAMHVHDWFTRGFADYFVQYPGLPTSTAHFIRPLFNLVYGQVAGLSGTSLYFSALVIAAGAALLSLAMQQIQTGRPHHAWAWFALLLPMMPAFASGIYVLLVPCLSYDPLAAVFCLLAYLCYRRNRVIEAAFALTLAVLTKETALPVVLAFACHRAGMSVCPGANRRHIFLQASVLATPALLWFALRWLAFGEVVGGSYTFEPGIHALMHRLLFGLKHWPINIDIGPNGWPGHWLSLLNLALAGTCALLMAHRLRRGLDAAEYAAAASYLFLVITGPAARYGACLDVFLLISVVSWQADVQLRKLAWLPLLLVVLSTGIALRIAAINWPGFLDGVRQLQQISRQYAQVLSNFKAGDQVLVLNDPATRFAKLDWMKQVLGLKADLLKISDYPWVEVGAGEVSPCRTSLEQDRQNNGYIFRQSCGIEFVTANSYGSMATSVVWPGLASIARIPDTHVEAGTPALWTGYRIQPAGRNTKLVYFDPESKAFHVVSVE